MLSATERRTGSGPLSDDLWWGFDWLLYLLPSLGLLSLVYMAFGVGVAVIVGAVLVIAGLAWLWQSEDGF